MRRAAKIDANQPEIVDALIRMSCSVQSLAAVGKGVPDLLIGISGRNYLVEVKDGNKAPSDRKLRPAQKDWHQGWSGQVTVIETVEQAVEWVNGVRNEQG